LSLIEARLRIHLTAKFCCAGINRGNTLNVAETGASEALIRHLAGRRRNIAIALVDPNRGFECNCLWVLKKSLGLAGKVRYKEASVPCTA
jgi:hypothetical protein